MSSTTIALTLVVFALTYVLIALRRIPVLPIGRPAGALLGATLMVVCGALTPTEAYAAIDGDTLVLLFGTMLLTAYLRFAGFFELAAATLLRRAGSPFRLLALVAVASGVTSAVLVNDTVCVFFTPIVVATCARAGLPMAPYLIAVATSANIGSAATLVGNPQNMIIGSLSKMPFLEFASLLGPAAAVSLALNVALLWLCYRRRLPASFKRAPTSQDANDGAPRTHLLLPSVVLLGVVAGFSVGLHLGFTALSGALVMVILSKRDPREALAHVDWPLLIFFAALFIVMGAVGKTGLARELMSVAAPHMNLEHAAGVTAFTGAMTLGSNVFSNVPLVLLAGPELAAFGEAKQVWALLAFVTTVAGNLTLVGSVANLIVAESARSHYKLGFFEYLRFGALSTGTSLAVGVPIVWALSR